MIEYMAATKTELSPRTHQRGSSWRAKQLHQRRVRMWTRIALASATLGAAGAIVAVIVISGSDAEPPAAPPDIQLQLGDYFISGDLDVAAGDVELEAVNVGVQPHNVGIRGGPITTNIAAGSSSRIDLGDLPPGDYELYCDIADHVARGMVATLHVSGAEATTSTTSSTTTGG